MPLEDLSGNTCDSHHSLIIAIHGTLNQLMGKADGWVKRIDGLEERQAVFEHRVDERHEHLEERFVAVQEAFDKRLDETSKKINQAIGMGKALGVVVGVMAVIATSLQIYSILVK
jgi:hypothetical protein